jgi:hypothetical protein
MSSFCEKVGAICSPNALVPEKVMSGKTSKNGIRTYRTLNKAIS